MKMKMKMKLRTALLSLLSLLSLSPPCQPCPSPCSCWARRSGGRLLAECAYRDLRAVPAGLSPNVTVLTLSANRLSRLPRAALAAVPELRALWLAHNGLVAVEPGALAALPELRSLDLSHNLLAELPWGDVRELRALQILCLSHNRLARLPREALAGLRELRSLWLNDNALAALEPGTFAALPALAQLQLFHNPFRCSCGLLWLKGWLLEGSVAVAGLNATRCAEPAPLRGLALTAVPDGLCVPPEAQLTFVPGRAPATLTLHCSASGSPAPRLRWSLRTAGRSLEVAEPGDGRFRAFTNGTLAVAEFGRADEGTYTCVATNEAGEHNASVRVALAGDGHGAQELPRDEPRDEPRAGHPERDQPDTARAGDALLIVYRVRSAAPRSRIPAGMVALVMVVLLCC